MLANRARRTRIGSGASESFTNQKVGGLIPRSSSVHEPLNLDTSTAVSDKVLKGIKSAVRVFMWLAV